MLGVGANVGSGSIFRKGVISHHCCFIQRIRMECKGKVIPLQTR